MKVSVSIVKSGYPNPKQVIDTVLGVVFSTPLFAKHEGLKMRSIVPVAIINLLLLAPPALSQEHDKQALLVLEKSIAAYRDAPALIDTMRYTATMPDGTTHEESVDIVLGSDGIAVDFGKIIATSNKNKFYITGQEPSSPYIERELDGSFANTFYDVLEGQLNIPLPHHVYARDGEGVAETLQAIGFGVISEPVLSGLESTVIDGVKMTVMHMSAANGWIDVRVHPETGFFHGMTIVASPGVVKLKQKFGSPPNPSSRKSRHPISKKLTSCE